LNNFIKNESVTIALLFSGLFLYLAGMAPSVLHSTLLVFGLASVWLAVLLLDVNRL
jgi:hypothetical protein